VEEQLLPRGEDEFCAAIDAVENTVLKLRHDNWLRAPPMISCSAQNKTGQARSPVQYANYSISRRVFFRFRLRASACLARFFSPGFK
jgi:hypothetical protein